MALKDAGAECTCTCTSALASTTSKWMKLPHPAPRQEIDSPLRRKVLSGAVGLLATSLSLPAWTRADPQMASEFWVRPRTLTLRHIRGERLTVTYWSDGELIISAYEELSWFMRDRVDNEAVYMHPVLLDIGYSLCGWLDYFGIREPLVLTSAYRTRRRNARIEGAALESHHTKGEAKDVRIPGVSTAQVAAFGRWLGGGGVGFYPGKDFTHLDTGRLRHWRG